MKYSRSATASASTSSSPANDPHRNRTGRGAAEGQGGGAQLPRLLVARGQYNPKMPLPAFPSPMGLGEVAAVGPGVTKVKPGQRVAACSCRAGPAGELDGGEGRRPSAARWTACSASYAVLPERTA